MLGYTWIVILHNLSKISPKLNHPLSSINEPEPWMMHKVMKNVVLTRKVKYEKTKAIVTASMATFFIIMFFSFLIDMLL